MLLACKTHVHFIVVAPDCCGCGQELIIIIVDTQGLLLVVHAAAPNLLTRAVLSNVVAACDCCGHRGCSRLLDQCRCSQHCCGQQGLLLVVGTAAPDCYGCRQRLLSALLWTGF